MAITLLTWSRAQFMGSLGFLIFFLSIAMGLAGVLFFFKWRAWRTGQAGWLAAYRFWVRIYALALVLSLSGAVAVLFQLGGLWAGLMERIGNVAGPLIGYAVISVFLFKSCFLGVMLFGQRRVSDRMHLLSIAMVALGQLVAVFWLVVLQAWLETPSGARLFEGRYQVYDWAAVILDPSLGWRMANLILAAALAAAFLVIGVCASQALRRKLQEGERLAFRTGLVVAVLATALQVPVTVGGYAATIKPQPAKAAAIAGFWHTGESPELVWLAWPNTRQQSNGAAWLTTDTGGALLARKPNGEYLGLDTYSGMHPPMPATFLTWRAVVLMWAVMAGLAWAALLRIRRRQFDASVLSRPLLRVLSATMALGALAAVARVWGDVLGLSPYVVQNAVTHSETLGPMLPQTVAFGTAGYAVLYIGLTAAFFGLVFHAARHGVVPVRRAGRTS